MDVCITVYAATMGKNVWLRYVQNDIARIYVSKIVILLE